MKSDRQLLQGITSGDLPSFEAFYTRHSDQVFRFALGIAGSASTAEDATQETFLQVMEQAKKFDPQRSASAIGWLYGLCRNQLRTLLRHPHQPHTPATHGEHGGSTLAEHYEWDRSITVISEALNTLSLEHREVLTLCGLQELDYATAAQALELPVGTVRSRLSRARNALRDALTKSIGGTLEDIGHHVS